MPVVNGLGKTGRSLFAQVEKIAIVRTREQTSICETSRKKIVFDRLNYTIRQSDDVKKS